MARFLRNNTTVTREVSEKFTKIECPLQRQKLHRWVSGGNPGGYAKNRIVPH